MTPRHASTLVALVGVLATRRAPAAPACAPTIEVTADVRARWPGLPAALGEALAARDDVDACARVDITAAGASIAVKVRLPDGRAAARLVTRREDVLPTLQGMLMVPEPPQAAAAEAEAPPLVRAPIATGELRVHAVSVASGGHLATPLPPERSRSTRIELAVATGPRMAGGQPGLGLGARSLIDLGGWLVGFEGRADAYDQGATAPPTGALGLALLGGRRLRSSGTLTLDLVVGAEAALQGSFRSVKQVGSPDPAMTTTSFRAAPRLLFGARLGFRATSRFRPFLGVEGDLGRAPTASALSGDLAPLPAWALGLALGAAVGTI